MNPSRLFYGLCALLLFGSTTRSTVVHARQKAVQAQAEGRARRLLDQGIASLSTRNLVQASRSIEDSFRAQPSAEALFYLGALALAEGRLLDAQDLMRRYLLDPRLSLSSDTPETQEAHRVLSQASPSSGQLGIQGAEGTLVSIDGKLRGSLPLARPLLLAPGRHEVSLEQGSKRQSESIEIAASRFYELRHSMSSGAVVILELPSVLLLDSQEGTSEFTTLTYDGLASQLRSENHTLLPRIDLKLPIDGKDAAECLESRTCQVKQGRKAGADVILRTRIIKRSADTFLQVDVVDPKVGDVAASGESRCTGCSSKDVVTELLKLAMPLLRQAQSRARGVIEIDSVPSGADVTIGSIFLGKTPLVHTLFAGPVELRVSLSGFEEQTLKAEIQAQQPTKLSPQLAPRAVLSPITKTPATQHVVRTESERTLSLRRIIGGGVSALGAVMLGFGISGLYMSTQCTTEAPAPSAICPEGYHTTVPGAALTAVGGVVLLTGVGLVAIPTPSRGK